jgi:hypothetical protein
VSLDDCDVPDSIVLAGGELAFDSRAIPHAVAHYAGSVDVPSHDRRRLVALNGGFVSVEGGRPGRLPGRIAGADGAVAFAVDAFDGDGDYVGSTCGASMGRRASGSARASASRSRSTVGRS